mmetsp:Transcript_34616/g.46431  ORF Transcript_34616/g.46431 Transcript_34616/m.46431 type:complete len:218 (+) Transcript_34616:2154-2807(+)
MDVASSFVVVSSLKSSFGPCCCSSTSCCKGPVWKKSSCAIAFISSPGFSTSISNTTNGGAVILSPPRPPPFRGNFFDIFFLNLSFMVNIRSLARVPALELPTDTPLTLLFETLEEPRPNLNLDVTAGSVDSDEDIDSSSLILGLSNNFPVLSTLFNLVALLESPAAVVANLISSSSKLNSNLDNIDASNAESTEVMEDTEETRSNNLKSSSVTAGTE